MKYASSILEVYLSMLSMLQLSNGINRDLNIYIYIYIYTSIYIYKYIYIQIYIDTNLYVRKETKVVGTQSFM